MLFDEAESQILATLYALEMRPEEWWHGRRGRLDREALRTHGRHFWADELEPWQGVIERLEERGLLAERDGELALTTRGREPAGRLREDYRRRRFDRVLVEAERSETYRTFCRRTGGLDLRAFSPLDAVQLDAVTDALALAPGDHLLDAGCGAGHVAEWIAKRTGARVLGIDQAAGAIRLARERTVDQKNLGFDVQRFDVQSVDVQSVDVQSVDAQTKAPRTRDRPRYRSPREDVPAGDAEGDFDAVLAIDSLAFVDDLEGALRRLVAQLRPGGRLVALALEAVDVPAEAPTARALAAVGLRPEIDDLSEHTLPILRARAFAVRALQAAFRREGCELLARVLSQESERLQPLLDTGRLRRLLYRASEPT